MEWHQNRAFWAKCSTFTGNSWFLDPFSVLHRSDSMKKRSIANSSRSSIETKIWVIFGEKNVSPNREIQMTDLYLVVSLFSQTTESVLVITCEVKWALQKDTTADSTIGDLFAYPSARRWKWILFRCENLTCFTLEDDSIWMLADESFPSPRQIAEKPIISTASVDRNLTNADWSRFKSILNLVDRLITSGKLNIRWVRITFTVFF
jgi:hypothetical protein